MITARAPRTVLVVFGTRPEAIKLAPVIIELKRQPRAFRTVLCTTAQHRQMLDPVLRVFDLKADIDLDLMLPDQELSGLTERVCHAMTGRAAAGTTRLVAGSGGYHHRDGQLAGGVLRAGPGRAR